MPVAVIGTEDVRRGWRFRPRHVRIRIGRPHTFPQAPQASPQLAAAVTERIWPDVRGAVAARWAAQAPARPRPERRTAPRPAAERPRATAA